MHVLFASTTSAGFPRFLAQVGGIQSGPGLTTAVGVVVLVGLLVLSAFFSSSEIALFSLERHRLDSFVEEGIPGAETVRLLKEDPHRLLVTILVGNNIANIAMSSIATGLLSFYVGLSQAVTIATFGITFFVLMFGESVPKSYAVENTETWSLRIARPLQLTEYALFPLVVVVDRLTRLLNRMVGGQAAIETSYVTREEIEDMVRTGQRVGVVDDEEREMIERIFRFRETIVKEVMTPRLDVVALERTATVEEGIRTAVHTGHSRLPVYDGNLDSVVGVVHVLDLMHSRNSETGADDLTLDQLYEPILRVPESKSVHELLLEMQKDGRHMAVVIDEFATTEGLVTTEDLAEEILGETLEADEERPIEVVDETTALVRGEVNVHEVNEALGIELAEEGEFETVAGFIFNRAGRLVEEGEEFVYRPERASEESDALADSDRSSADADPETSSPQPSPNPDPDPDPAPESTDGGVRIVVEQVADARIIRARIIHDRAANTLTGQETDTVES